MARAIWNGVVVAESEQFEMVEGNVYFPPDALRMEHFKPSTHTSVCPWKGTASYYDVEVEGQINAGAAWYYPEPKTAAASIRDHVAFWKGVEVQR